MSVCGLAVALLQAPGAAAAQEPVKSPRIAVLCGTTRVGNLMDVFRERLTELGQGRSVAFEYRSADGRFERLPQLAAELTQLNPDVIVALGANSTVPAARATRAIPVVFFGAGDPVALGIVQSIARPGGNVTGLTYSHSAEYWPKLLELFKAAVPRLQRVGLLSDIPAERPGWWPKFEQAGRALGVQTVPPVRVRRRDDFADAIASLRRSRADGVILTTAGTTFVDRDALATELERARLPSLALAREVPEAGGFMSYGANFRALYVRLATYVDRILRGAKPSDLPVQFPAKFEMVVNLKTAKALGLAVPQSILLRADEVIE